MKHPRMNNYLVFKKISDDPDAEDAYEVWDYINGETWYMNRNMAMFLYNLDGKKNPYCLLPDLPAEEVDEILKTLERKRLLLTPAVKKKLKGMRPLYIPRFGKKARKISKFLNWILMLSFIPALAVAAFFFYDVRDVIFEGELYYLMVYGPGICSMIVFHEIGHAIACLAYGGKVFEFGLISCGAYTSICADNVKSRWKRIQISAAGVEMNILIGSIWIMIAAIFDNTFRLSNVMCGAANYLTAILNLLFLPGTDGIEILQEIIGKRKKTFKPRRREKRKTIPKRWKEKSAETRG